MGTPHRPYRSVRKAREKIHGTNVYQNHSQLGRAWAAILSQHYIVVGENKIPDLPPRIVCLMLAQLKLLRAAKPHAYNADDYCDAKNYLDFAEELEQKEHEHESNQGKNAESHAVPVGNFVACVEAEQNGRADFSSL